MSRQRWHVAEMLTVMRWQASTKGYLQVRGQVASYVYDRTTIAAQQALGRERSAAIRPQSANNQLIVLYADA